MWEPQSYLVPEKWDKNSVSLADSCKWKSMALIQEICDFCLQAHAHSYVQLLSDGGKKHNFRRGDLGLHI